MTGLPASWTHLAQILSPIATPGAIMCLGLLGGAAQEFWPEPLRSGVAFISFGLVALAAAWIVLIFVYRLTNWSRLSDLDRDHKTS